MKYLKLTVVGMALCLGIAAVASAQTATASQTVTMQVNAIAVLRVTGNPAALIVSAPGTPGDTPTNPSDSSTYAQYTSTVPSGTARRLTAAWGSADAAPAGCELRLTVTPQGGNRGTSGGTIVMSATAQNIVTGIMSCRTGTGPTDGAQLTYQLVVTNEETLVAGQSRTATVTLTLTAAS